MSEVPHIYSAWISHLCFSVTPVFIIPIENTILQGIFFFRGQNVAWKALVEKLRWDWFVRLVTIELSSETVSNFSHTSIFNYNSG